jgi:hypothetical protein
MGANTQPIFTRFGKIGMGVKLLIAAADYTGVTADTREVFGGDDTNGAFIERIRFKALGTNIQTVARIYLNSVGINTVFGSAPAAPTATATGSGTTIIAGTYYAKVVAIGPSGARSPIGTESAGVTATAGQSIPWAWTAINGAVSYEIYVADATGKQLRYFTSATNSYSQTAMWQTGAYKDPAVGNMQLYGEITLPATTAVANAATADIDYFMNIALEPGTEIYVGLGTTVAAGWACCAIGGIY